VSTALNRLLEITQSGEPLYLVPWFVRGIRPYNDGCHVLTLGEAPHEADEPAEVIAQRLLDCQVADAPAE